MATTRLEVRFPCGYELRYYMSAFGTAIGLTNADFRECPLHGKNCVRTSKKERGNKK